VAPTDQSADMAVVLSTPTEILTGDTVVPAARVRAGERDVPNAAVVLESSDIAVLEVEPDGRIYGNAAGTAVVTARARQYRGALPAQVTITVRAPVEVDSVAPTRVRYGAVLTVFGVGLDPSVGNLRVAVDGEIATIVSFTPEDSTAPLGRGMLGIVAAPPLGVRGTGESPSDVEIVVASDRGAANFIAAVTVEQQDIYEPNHEAPAHLGVVTDGFSALGLAFDRIGGADSAQPFDWYSFTTETAGDWTVTVQAPKAWLAKMGVSVIPGELSPPLIGVTTRDPWWWDLREHASSAVGHMQACRGFAGTLDPGRNNIGSTLGVPGGDGDTDVRLTLSDLPAGRHQLFIVYTFPSVVSETAWGPFADIGGGEFHSVLTNEPFVKTFAPLRYDLTIEPGTTGALERDAWEGNDVCEQAPVMLTAGTADIRDTLVANFDAELDVDWYEVVVESAGRLFLDIAESNPDSRTSVWLLAPTASVPDSALDVVRTEAQGDFERPLTSYRDGQPGASLDPGRYYLLVKPDAAQPGTYAIAVTWIAQP
jgi:hypothetical protein